MREYKTSVFLAQYLLGRENPESIYPVIEYEPIQQIILIMSALPLYFPALLELKFEKILLIRAIISY